MLKFIKTIIFGERIQNGIKVDYDKIPVCKTLKPKDYIDFNDWAKKYNVSKTAKNY